MGGWIFPNNEIDINARISPRDNVWRDIDLGTNNDVPVGTQAIIIHLRNTSATTAYGAFVRPIGSSLNPSSGIAPLNYEYLFVKLDGSRKFQAYAENAALDLRIVAYSGDDLSIYPYVDKTPGVAGSYQDVAVSGDGVPSGSAAAIFCVHSPGRYWGIRKNGTTYDSYKYQSSNTQNVVFGALDGSRLTEVKIDSTPINFWLQGYIPGAQGVMFDTPTEKTPANAGSWQDVDCSAIIPAGASGAILEVRNTGGSNWFACVRKKGSSNDFSSSNKEMSNRHHHAVVGVDGSRVFQAYVGHATDVDIFVLGYILAPAQAITGAGAIASAEALGTLLITPGAVAVSPPSIPSAETFGLAAIVPGGVTISPLSISSLEAFGVPGVYRIPKSLRVTMAARRLEVTIDG
jgi:hypothetical protein